MRGSEEVEAGFKGPRDAVNNKTVGMVYTNMLPDWWNLTDRQQFTNKLTSSIRMSYSLVRRGGGVGSSLYEIKVTSS